ncbi:MAG: hypothetical protein OER74_04045 [Desulfobacteraceae bacterium]|nr:hypothetical protein [Desulfobacteraceae bacterium]
MRASLRAFCTSHSKIATGSERKIALMSVFSQSSTPAQPEKITIKTTVETSAAIVFNFICTLND